MVPPIATYRLQFRNGMTFDKAVEIVPYLKRLGVSHLYASPIFSAVADSTHGYDVTDHNEIDPASGGIDGFERLHAALKEAGLGLILDIVPNHMAASLENRWWRSVVEHGAASLFARHFDIDWSERLTLPILGRPYDEVLADGELRLKADLKHGCLALAYFDNLLPLQPSTYRMVAEELADEDAAEIAELAEAADPGDRAFHDAMRAFLAGEGAARLEARLDELAKNPTFIGRLHEAQPWRLMFWKEARRHLSYRRFFEVTGLVGVRVEDSAVFADVHRLTFELVRSGKVDGLRVDHVDGLALPGAYLRRLRDEVGPDVPILVEKILGEGEKLPDWPISGTTGYEFIPALADLLVDPDGSRELEKSYGRFIGREIDVAAELREAKLLILRRNFEGELGQLTRLAVRLVEAHGRSEIGQTEIGDAIAEIIVGFPVYRTYGESGRLGPADADVLSSALGTALAQEHAEAEAIDFVAKLLRGDAEEETEGAAGASPADAVHFRTRFQQLTGPVMAKAVEDTFFYRHNAFIALNEVGSSPGVQKGSVERFHGALQDYAVRPPGLLATATHDTKRGEDSRARLYAIAEEPTLWSEAVARWSAMNAGFRGDLADGAAPEPETEWLLYQSLAGLWPADPDRPDEEALGGLAERFLPYVEKALREAKRRTDWLDADEEYEGAVRDYANALLAAGNQAFLDDFCATLGAFIEAGMTNSASQLLAKLTAPGIPDIYQGSEAMDFSLVDPDNRRPVDYPLLMMRLERVLGGDAASAASRDGSFKQWLIAKCLACRREYPELFAAGDYVPLKVSGSFSLHFAAYLRTTGEHVALVILQRLPLRLRSAASAEEAAEQTFVELPDRFGGSILRNVLTGAEFSADTRLPLRTVLQEFPVALAVGTTPRA